MKIKISKNGKTITSLDKWFELAPPKRKEKQWKVGRSAMEMARFALSDSFSGFISQVLKECKLESLASDFECEPEANSSFGKGMGKGESRNHDLLMIGKDVLIGVEAKVSESFDKQISKKRKEVKDQTRINKFIQYIYGDNAPKNVKDLYYQLFSATIGSIKEAERRGDINNVIVLFIVFKEKLENKKTNDKNDEAFNAFCTSLNLKKNQPISFPEAQNINCWIKKVEIGINSNYQFNW
jgi:hypothetical protein